MMVSKQVDQGVIFNIQSYNIHDGPGIRTLVFLKGCPLRCLWCSNPESINDSPELGFRQSLCDGCGRCIGVCPLNALSLGDEEHTIKIDRARCDSCGVCVQACARDALTVYGQSITVGYVVGEVAKDKPFYRRSGGGVTISGGEPLSQPRFLLSILKGCRQQGIHTAIETCGYCGSRIFKTILSEVDLVFLDLKVMDVQQHLALTGKNNRLILNNARLLASANCKVQPRMPLIPTINDNESNIAMVASFLKSLGWTSIELMPYHRFGVSKYRALGRSYGLSDIASATPEDVEKACKLFRKHGVECWASV